MSEFSRRTFLAGGVVTAVGILSSCTGPVGRVETSTPPGLPPGASNPEGRARCEFGDERSLKIDGATRVFPGVLKVSEAVILRPILRLSEAGEVIGAQKVVGRDNNGVLELQNVTGVKGWQITEAASKTPPMGMIANDGCADLDGARRTLVPSQAVTLEQSFDFEGLVVPVFEPGIAEKDVTHDSLWKIGAFGVHISLHTEAKNGIPSDLINYTNPAIKNF